MRERRAWAAQISQNNRSQVSETTRSEKTRIETTRTLPVTFGGAGSLPLRTGPGLRRLGLRRLGLRRLGLRTGPRPERRLGAPGSGPGRQARFAIRVLSIRVSSRFSIEGSRRRHAQGPGPGSPAAANSDWWGAATGREPPASPPPPHAGRPRSWRRRPTLRRR